MKKLLFILTIMSLVVLSACQTDTTEKDNTIADLQTEVAELKDELANLSSDLTASEAEVAAKQAELATALANLQAELNDLSGTYIGYSWRDEDAGVLLEDATQKIETKLVLDKDGNILDASVLFWKLKDGSWYSRQDGTAHVTTDMSVTPVAATPGANYAKGTSMFTIDTHDFMSMYAVEVDVNGNAAFMFVDPTTRYMFEIYLPNGYDYSTTIGNVTVNGTSGGFIPSVRTSSSGVVKPDAWSELDGKHMFNISPYNHVMYDNGVFLGLSGTSTMQELMESVGVTFTTGIPNEFSVDYGRHSNGGWQGNYEAIAAYLIGKNVFELQSLVDWDVAKWGDAVNDDNFFGIDVVAGSTKTAQDSFDTIAGATVRMSRESTSYQRALVAAGVLTEEQVIKGRF